DAIISIIEIVNGTHGIVAARSRLETYAREYPRLPELWFALADLYIASGNLAEAEKVISQLVSNEDKVIGMRAKNRLARIYLVLDKPDQAENLVDEILQLDPRNVSAIVTRAELLVNQGHFGQAVRALRS